MGRRGAHRERGGVMSVVGVVLAVTACGCGPSRNTIVDAGTDHGVDLGVSPDQGRPRDQGGDADQGSGPDLGAADQSVNPDQDLVDQGVHGFHIAHQNTAGATVSRSESFRMVRMHGRSGQGSSSSNSRSTHVTGGRRP